MFLGISVGQSEKSYTMIYVDDEKPECKAVSDKMLRALVNDEMRQMYLSVQ